MPLKLGIAKIIFPFVLIIYASPFAYSQSEDKNYWDSTWYFYNKGKYSQSIKYIDKLLKKYPQSSQYQQYKSVILFTWKKYDETIVLLNDVLKANPYLPDAYNRRAMANYEIGKLDSSLADFTRAIGILREQDSIAFRGKAMIYLEKKEYPMAIINFDSAALFKPKDRFFYVKRYTAYFFSGDLINAKKQLNLALKMHYDSDYSDQIIITARAETNYSLKEKELAMSDCNLILKTDPNNLSALFIRGQIHMENKKFDLAVIDFNKCSQQKMSSKELYALRGTANYYLANDQKAIDDLNKAIEMDPSNSILYILRAECKHNLKSGSGCTDMKTALSLGNEDAKRLRDEYCK